MPLSAFHPVIQSWFRRRLGEPTVPQAESWPAIRKGRHTLIAAPTGTGKTLAAFLSSLDRLIRLGIAGELGERTEVVYISPLRALSADVRKNLEGPLAELGAEAMAQGSMLPPIQVGLRTGDTDASERQKQARRPPHILVTTPESLALLLTAEKSRRHLTAVRTVIVDEIHALIQDKRGAHLLLSLERLDALCEEHGNTPPQRIGLSATVHPLAEVARYLVGSHRVRPDEDGVLDDGEPDCHIVDGRGSLCAALAATAPSRSSRGAGNDTGQSEAEEATGPALLRELDLRILTPAEPLGPVCTTEQWQDVHDQIARLIEEHKTTLVFVSTRRLAERTAHGLAERLGDGAVMAHHGSLSRAMRLTVEDRLKSGQLKAVVATASLELGIDIGAIDLVCQLGSPRAIATFLQRVGRANHRPDVSAVPRGRLFALTRDELVESSALLRAIRAGRLDRQRVPDCPLDVLAQQLVAWCSTDERDETWLYERARRAWPFRGLTLDDYHHVLTVLADGVATRRGRPSAHLHWDRVGGKLRGRRGAHLFVLQNGGTIPEPNDYEVVKEPEGVVIGRLDEEFVVESAPGDVFLLGSSAWRLVRVSSGRAHVTGAGSAAPTVPFWAGEAPGRTFELSQAVAELRKDVEQQIGLALSSRSPRPDEAPGLHAEDLPELLLSLQERCGLDAEAARQLVEYLVAGRLALGALPTHDTLIAERFFDEGGGMQLILHAPFGARINRAFGLSLRKKFCRAFNFELQAAATDDGVLLSLGETHSFPLETVWEFLKSERVEQVLSQAVLGAPVFQPHFRHVATRALQIPRQRGGKKLPPPIVRILAEDLLAAVFPNAAACPENLPGGDIEIPEHPLVTETLRECLREVMDIDGLRSVLRRIEAGEIKVCARDTSEPSPLAQHLLFAAPYAFLDDTPFEERRTRAVAVRKPRGPHLADEVLPYAPENGLDPAAIEAVQKRSWPHLRDADELADALLGLYYLPRRRCDFLGEHAAATGKLIEARRATLLYLGDEVALVASERAAAVRLLFTVLADEDPQRPAPRFVPEPPEIAARPGTRSLPLDEVGAEERVLTEAVRGWLAVTGPWRTADLAALLLVPVDRMQGALLSLEAEGMALRGRFLPASPDAPDPDEQFCDRRLLLSIHRSVRQTFRRSIEPATPAQLWQLLARWQHAWPGTQLDGGIGLGRLLHQLQGFVAGAASWEEQLLPLRLRGYDPAWLDGLCLAGEVAWGRLVPTSGEGRLGRLTPLSLWRRADTLALLPPRPPLSLWTVPAEGETEARLSQLAVKLVAVLERRGARFFAELCRECARPPREVAAALGELVAAGLVSSDGFAGLRLLLREGSDAGDGAMAAGRWALLEGPSIEAGEEAADKPARARFRGTQPVLRAEASWGAEADWDNPAILEAWVDQYLARYGVVLRELLTREPLGPPMSVTFPLLRRMEARGLLRSGYFVSGLAGEQFMTPEAWTGLELIRKEARKAPIEVRIGAADPLNLAGILFPGPKVPSTATGSLLYRDGEPASPPPSGEDAPAPRSSPPPPAAAKDAPQTLFS